MNIAKMMKQAQEMQQKMEDAQNDLESIEVVGSAGAGMVEVVMNCKYAAKSVKIDPKIIDADEAEMLEDLITAAINNATSKANATAAQEMSKISSGMNLPAGMKLPF